MEKQTVSTTLAISSTIRLATLQTSVTEIHTNKSTIDSRISSFGKLHLYLHHWSTRRTCKFHTEKPSVWLGFGGPSCCDVLSTNPPCPFNYPQALLHRLLFLSVSAEPSITFVATWGQWKNKPLNTTLAVLSSYCLISNTADFSHWNKNTQFTKVN